MNMGEYHCSKSWGYVHFPQLTLCSFLYFCLRSLLSLYIFNGTWLVGQHYEYCGLGAELHDYHIPKLVWGEAIQTLAPGACVSSSPLLKCSGNIMCSWSGNCQVSQTVSWHCLGNCPTGSCVKKSMIQSLPRPFLSFRSFPLFQQYPPFPSMQLHVHA